MNRAALSVESAGSQRSEGSWSYWRPEWSAEVVELGTVYGRGAELPTHFHDEAQLTFVLSGRRTFLLPSGLVELDAGHGVIIPAAAPHRSLAESANVVCFNAYLPAGRYAVSALIAGVRRLWRTAGCIPWAEVTALVGDHREDSGAPLDPADRPAGVRATVQELADRSRMSREGYSRMFARRYRISPHAYLLTCRLNEARSLLRAGMPIAQAANEAGFADQSHLGRWFRRAFGTTPGRYRRQD
jgi:AraC-like DNA-binding protein/quercetin dioxygenase-like cupin family protein